MHYYSAMARNDPQLNLRLPAELKAQLEKAAEENNRTLTAETVARLESSFDPQGDVDALQLLYRYEYLLEQSESERLGLKLRVGELAAIAEIARRNIPRSVIDAYPELKEDMLTWDEPIVEGLATSPEELGKASDANTARLAVAAERLAKTLKIHGPSGSGRPEQYKQGSLTSTGIKPELNLPPTQRRLKFRNKKDAPAE